MDVLDCWNILRPELPGMRRPVHAGRPRSWTRSRCGKRLTDLSGPGFDGIAFVGVPRTMKDGEERGCRAHRCPVDL